MQKVDGTTLELTVKDSGWGGLIQSCNIKNYNFEKKKSS